MEKSKVMIILLNWNGYEDTVECLESLKKLTYKNYEIIVVDNNSTGDDVDKLESKYEDYIYIIRNNKNDGFAEGNNVGIRYALDKSADLIVILNNDTIVAPDFITELVKSFENDSHVGIAGPKTFCYDEPDLEGYPCGSINFWTGNTHFFTSEELRSPKFNNNVEVDFVNGTCMMFSRKLLLEIGILDKRFFFGGGEDLDICIRAKRKGYKVMCVPTANIWHKGDTRSRSKRGEIYGYYMIRNMFLLRKKHWNVLQYITSICFFLLSMPRFIIIFMKYYRSFGVFKSCIVGTKDYIFNKDPHLDDNK